MTRTAGKTEKRKREAELFNQTHPYPFPYRNVKRRSLETVKRTLLLLLIERIHPLLQLRPGSLSLTTRTPLLLNSLQRPALRIALLAQRPQLLFHLKGLLLPRLAVRFHLVTLRLEVAEGFF